LARQLQNLESSHSVPFRKDLKVNFTSPHYFVIYSVNSDGLSPLDVAVLSNNRPLAKMLVAFGAQEGNQCKYNRIQLQTSCGTARTSLRP